MKARIPWLTAALIVAAGAAHAFPSIAGALLLDRSAVLAGQVWRLFTGHWIHFTIQHLLFDLAVIAVSGAWLELKCRFHFITLLVGAQLAVPVAILGLAPGVQQYGGSSGIAAALIACCCIKLWQQSRSIAPMLALAGIVLKMGADWGGLRFDSGLLPAGVQAEPISHAAGALSGAVFALLLSSPLGRFRLSFCRFSRRMFTREQQV